jgi:hypothetical protein
MVLMLVLVLVLVLPLVLVLVLVLLQNDARSSRRAWRSRRRSRTS